MLVGKVGNMNKAYCLVNGIVHSINISFHLC